MGIWKLTGKASYLASLFSGYMLAEGIWEAGAWQWGALCVAFLVIGYVLNNWDRLVAVRVSDDAKWAMRHTLMVMCFVIFLSALTWWLVRLAKLAWVLPL